ncbi:phospho-sugar mutase [Photobacterium halotolerans]|uniref:Phospho-sugar mutase n=1 Tax=Photobacterium halotolerans TaxID=265726 RepID=A0A7X4WNI5_9GAMM|nr:phospho-sugar mutase [Photobacterium halotolerans]NAW65544.1 phospho-sugar mutase [Photobacterium halotolerans]NAW85884.1 phospho-sugar mutase [Photobacterium halotolerans]NAX45752.1 phospho-sugar mutase [Photobacterium halotolerans]
MKELITRWLARDPDPVTREELQNLIDAGNEQELSDRFSGRLAFGTAGLRGIVGAGPNRMNRLVIQETATGLGQYLQQTVPQAKQQGIVIGYDGRPDSKTFAHDAASVLTAQGIKVYLTVTVAPTPLVAYGVTVLKAAAGIVVTASHNPPAYNGFKVYWGNGAQIIPPHDKGIAAAIDKAAIGSLDLMDLDEARNQGLLVWLDDEFYNDYRASIKQSALLQNHAKPEAVSIAYTAMHGVGAQMAETLLADAGFTHVYSVAAQREPDGTFPTVNFPNPEEPGAMDLVIAEAEKHHATLACANDPDADRFAVAVRTPEGQYKMLTGDQVGVLLGHYLLTRANPETSLVGTTIVSSSLLQKVASRVGADYYQTLTGFKWLTNIAMEKQREDSCFLFAYEEALGYTVGNMVWDKDGLSAMLAFAQMTAELTAQGRTVWDQLEAIYREHGLYVNSQVSIALSPNSPPIGDALRQQPPEEIAGRKVVRIDDLKSSTRYKADGSVETIDLPASDVLIYFLEDDSRVVVRPSGTEPKLKCYYEVVEVIEQIDTLEHAYQRAQSSMDELVQRHQNSLTGLTDR